MSNWAIRSPYSCAGFRRFTVVVPFARPLAGSRPRDCWTTRLGTGAFAARDAPFEADAAPIPSDAFGTDRQFALTRTSTLGIVYATSPRACVSHGSTTRHDSIGWKAVPLAVSPPCKL